MKTFDGYSKEKFSDTSVLLAGGGSKELSNFIGTLNWDSTNRKLQYKKIGDTNWNDLVTFGSNALNSTAYLPLAGGTMSGNISMGTNHIIFHNTYDSDWNSIISHNYGIGILNTVGQSAIGASYSYGVGLYVQGYYGFQLACYGGGNLFSIRGTRNGNLTTDYQPTDWYVLLHSGNTYFGTVSETTVPITINGTTYTFSNNLHTHSQYVDLTSAQTITGVKTFAYNTFILAGWENNAIKHATQANYNWGGYGSANTTPDYTGMYNSLDFYWYNDIWSIGNLRGSGTGTNGFGIGLKKTNNDGNMYFAPAFRVTETESYINNNKVWHAGNDGSGSGLDADKLDGLDSSDFYRIYTQNNSWADKVIPLDLSPGMHKIHIPGIEYSSILCGRDYKDSYWQLYFHPSSGYTTNILYRASNTDWMTLLTSANYTNYINSTNFPILGYSPSNFVLWKGDNRNIGGSSPAATVKTYWENDEFAPRNMVTLAYNSAGYENTLIFSKNVSANIGNVLRWGQKNLYLYLLKYNGKWETDDWVKIYAGYADSAGNADTLDGYHASDFATADHNHNYVSNISWDTTNKQLSYKINNIPLSNITISWATESGQAHDLSKININDLLNMTGALWDGFAFNYYSGKSDSNGKLAKLSIRIYDGAYNEIARFNKSGYFGLGTSSPAYKLDVVGTARFSTSGFGASLIVKRTSGTPVITFVNGDTVAGYIGISSLTNTIYWNNTTSDYNVGFSTFNTLVGGISTPVYVAKNGQLIACNSYPTKLSELTNDPGYTTPTGHGHNLGNKSASDLSSTYPSGISTGGIYNNGYPFAYGCTITSFANGGTFLIAGQWNSNVSGTSNYDFPTEMYIRGRRDSFDVWTTWSRVLTNRNYSSYALPLTGGTCTGNIYAPHFYESSDIRQKTDFSTLTISTKELSTIPLFDFSWKENLSSRNTGTSAQAVQSILPNLVTESNNYLKLDYGVLGTIAGITACKELVILKSEIEQLRERVAELEQKLNDYGIL